MLDIIIDLVQMHWGGLTAQTQIEHFYDTREGHGKIEIFLEYRVAGSFSDQGHPH